MTYNLIEPSDYNLPKLKRNIARNLDRDRYRILDGLVDARRGEATFYQSRWQRWGSSVYRRRAFMERASSKPYVDVGELLREGPCVLKVDIEGAEFQMLDIYRDDLDSVLAPIMEWHAECGDFGAGESILKSCGLARAHRHEPGPDRLVDLYVRQVS